MREQSVGGSCYYYRRDVMGDVVSYLEKKKDKKVVYRVLGCCGAAEYSTNPIRTEVQNIH